MAQKIITLLTDFGTRDSYVAEMKGTILCASPDAKIVDISHEAEKFNVRAGAYILACAAPCFPKGTVHVAVVDPGVGTEKQPIIIQTSDYFFVGPDNGILTLALKNDGQPKRIHKILNQKLLLPSISNTFYGRDVMAPTAAHLANGRLPREFGQEIDQIVIPDFAKITRKKNMLEGEIIHVDDFGNVVTNLKKTDLQSAKIGSMLKIRFRKDWLKIKLCRTYADVQRNQALALIASHNFLEISINQGNAGKHFKVKSGDRIRLCHSWSSLEAYSHHRFLQ